MGTYTTAQHIELFGGLPDRGEAAVDPRELADMARDEACSNPYCRRGWVERGDNESGGAPAFPCKVCNPPEDGSGPVACNACGYRQSTPGECFRCGESPGSIAAAVADREQTERADRWL